MSIIRTAAYTLTGTLCGLALLAAYFSTKYTEPQRLNPYVYQVKTPQGDILVKDVKSENMWLISFDDCQLAFTATAVAKVMKEAYEESTVFTLLEGDWHLPYIDKVFGYDAEGNPEVFYTYDGKEVSLEEAKAISVACCAAVSYRMEDITVDKAQDIYKKLGVGTNKFHASPFEHVCTPWQEHEEVEKGNLFGFHQLRHLL